MPQRNNHRLQTSPFREVDMTKKEYMRAWREKNREKIAKDKKNYREKYPWMSAYYHAKARCLDKNIHTFKRYAGKGIKFLMKKEDFKFLWFRDKAYLMKSPSIDRINSNDNYELKNCRFIELIENLRLGGKLGCLVEKGIKTRFIKGHKSGMTGKHHSAETKIKMAKSLAISSKSMAGKPWGIKRRAAEERRKLLATAK